MEGRFGFHATMLVLNKYPFLQLCGAYFASCNTVILSVQGVQTTITTPTNTLTKILPLRNLNQLYYVNGPLRQYNSPKWNRTAVKNRKVDLSSVLVKQLGIRHHPLSVYVLRIILFNIHRSSVASKAKCTGFAFPPKQNGDQCLTVVYLSRSITTTFTRHRSDK